jgi:hypothetical protein
LGHNHIIDYQCTSTIRQTTNEEIIMAKRKKLSRKGSKKLFKATADRTHRMNVNMRPLRGGTRL